MGIATKSVLGGIGLLSFFLGFVYPLGCLDENGAPVDGWTAIKAAYHTYDYFVFNGEEFIKSNYTLDQDVDGCIMRTMQQAYSSANIAIGMYNDEPPPDDTVSSSYAHSKGVLVSSATQGFWLVHSMPHWPNNLTLNSPGIFPDDTYGQSLQCVTISSSIADNIASNFIITRPYVYSQNITAELALQLPYFSTWLDHVYTTIVVDAQTPFVSLAGNQYYQMAKSKYWKEDLWDDMVAPYFSAPINVETWRNGAGGRMGSMCSSNSYKVVPYAVDEIAQIKMPDGMTWNGTQDHSKWCASIFANISNVTCVGDINRMCSQEARGGGAMCLEDPKLWNAFNSIISKIEPCWQYNPCTGTSTKCYWCSPSTMPTVSPFTLFPTYASPTKSPDSSLSPTVLGPDETRQPTYVPTIYPTVLPTESSISKNGNPDFNIKDNIPAVIGITVGSAALVVAAVYLLYSYMGISWYSTTQTAATNMALEKSIINPVLNEGI